MQVFLSWSGERSRLVADRTKVWLKCVIQSLQPWMSSDDIGKGTLWFNEISDTLSSSSVGIVFLTRENLSSSWILFEAGALANGLSAKRVCTVLVDIKPSDVKDPLAQFNHTLISEQQEMKKLVNTINASLGENGLPTDVLSQVFDTYWPEYSESIKHALLESESKHSVDDSPVRTESDILSEILDATRNMEKRLIRVERDNRKLSFDKDNYDSLSSYGKKIINDELSKSTSNGIEDIKGWIKKSKIDIPSK